MAYVQPCPTVDPANLVSEDVTTVKPPRGARPLLAREDSHRVDRTLAPTPAYQKLCGQHRHRHHRDRKHVDENEGTAPVLTGEVGKPPDVAEPYCASDRREDEHLVEDQVSWMTAFSIVQPISSFEDLVGSSTLRADSAPAMGNVAVSSNPI